MSKKTKKALRRKCQLLIQIELEICRGFFYIVLIGITGIILAMPLFILLLLVCYVKSWLGI